MNEASICRRLRKEFDKTGFTLLVYYGIMSAVVSAVMVIQMVALMFLSPDMTDAERTQALMGNGWGYILTLLIGSVILLLWKKREFCFHTIWQRNRRMTVGSFFAILSVFLSAQLFFQISAMVTEWFFNLFGLSVMESLEMATGIGDTFSMFVYGCLLAPVFEEVLFRGLLLRNLAPYGKKFAVFATAFLFGLFHANLLQSPFAFAVGLVLGYVTVEYSMVWAVILHAINNLVLGDLLPRITSFFQPWVGEAAFWGIICTCTVAAIVICIVKRRQILWYLLDKRIHPWCMKSFFTSVGILAFTVFMLFNIVLTLVLSA